MPMASGLLYEMFPTKQESFNGGGRCKEDFQVLPKPYSCIADLPYSVEDSSSSSVATSHTAGRTHCLE